MRPFFLLLFAVGVLFFAFLGVIGGPAQPLDVTVIAEFAGWRQRHPEATSSLILLTHLGGAPVLLTLAVLGTIWLVLQGMPRTAACLLLTVSLGRLGVEGLKLLIGRARPALDAHPVEVFSQSFPSGHAGNSMVTYLALALFVAPPAWRRPAVAAALLLAVAIGSTRPMLGVHWPTDVLAGWLYGLLVVSLAWRLRWRERSAA